ncbi:ABC transporter [Archangium sp. Cb G35]|uniref:Gldg family protein n=1 Tax=Archangium sp. Cb G35 TaxID=1920190 RepID=UPI0009368ABC|nr:Gldg family protein [Archangium sp. Cb G35]OJT18449.1 ABC transporter [Archangium sp. Cb G35]
MTLRPNPWVSVLYGLGLLTVFLGERVVGAGTQRLVLSGMGLTLVGLAVAWRGRRVARAHGEWRVLERWQLGLFLLGGLGLALYFLRPGERGAMAVVLGALFPALLTTTLLPLVLVELAAAAMSRAPVLQLGRVRAALYSGLGLAFALVFAFSATYVATRADVSWDLAYFRTARPGAATRLLTRQIPEPVRVTLFFPPANDVRQALEQYFRELARESGYLEVEVLDQAVARARAKELGVGENGTVVFSRGARHERLKVPLELDRARVQLQRLDEDVYRRLRVVSRPRRVLYLTAGQGERGLQPQPATALEKARPGLSQLEEWLRVLNVEVRTLGMAEGLGKEVPRGAAVVAVVGPERDFSPEALATLRRYVERGGRLWLALEPDGPGLEPLLEPLGLKLLRVPLANELRYLRMSHQQSDRGNLVTASFSSHASVGTLASLGSDAAIVFAGAAALEPVPPLPKGVTHDVSVRAPAETFQDTNHDFAPDQGEPRGSWPLVVAVQKAGVSGASPARVVVMGDSDVMTDSGPRSYGNPYLLMDTVLWLLGEEELAGVLSNEEDVPLQHTRQQDVVWFYSAVFVAPALVLGAGFLVTRRRRRRGAR